MAHPDTAFDPAASSPAPSQPQPQSQRHQPPPSAPSSSAPGLASPSSAAGAAPGPTPRPAGRGPGRAAAVCVGLSVASLALPATLAFDPWAWLVWGREVTGLELDTTGGPSWKPLPVLLTTVLSVFGDLAPTLWTVLARAAGLFGLVLAFRLAARFAGPMAGAVAGVLLVLTPDGDPRYLRLVVEAHSAPLSTTLLLWAIDRHLAARYAPALLLATAFALERPEAWPFLGLYALWLWRREPTRRRLIGVALVAVPVLWFGGDLWGSGDPWHGADAAQVVSDTTVDRLRLVAERTGDLVAWPAWLAAAAGVVSARRRGESVLVRAGVGALAWIGIVGAMAVGLGYAALSRFLLPTAALLCVLAGVGVARLVGAVPAGGWRRAAVLAVAALGVVGAVPRVLPVDTVVDGVRERARAVEEMNLALDRAGGRDAVLACGRVAVAYSNFPRMPLAWELDVPLDRVDRRLPADGPGVAFVRAGGRQEQRFLARSAAAREIGRSPGWAVYAVGCPETGAGSAGSRVRA